MEQMNRIELRGNVGSATLTPVGDTQVLRLTVATNYVYKDRNGSPVIDTTWHNVSVWEGKGMPDLASVQRGDCVHIVGRMRNAKFTSSDGTEKQYWEVLASDLAVEKEQSKSQVGF